MLFDYAYAACCLWTATGFFLDAWAHGHVPVESFFTPYHGVFYSGMLALAIVVANMVRIRRAHGVAWRFVIPRPYRFALLGFPIFVVAGVGDLLWHLAFGIEEGVDALLSPTHQALGLGMFVLASGPVRSVLAHRARAVTLVRQLPLVFALATWLILFHFGTAYAFDPGAGGTNAPPPVAPFTPQYLTALSIGLYKISMGVLVAIFQSLAIAAIVLWAVARIRLQPGAITLLLLLGNAPAAAAFTNATPLLAVTLAQSLLAGLVADLLIARYDPEPSRRRMYHAFAVAVPLAYTGTYLVGTALADGLWWDWNVALGAWMWAGVVGFALSLLGTARRA